MNIEYKIERAESLIRDFEPCVRNPIARAEEILSVYRLSARSTPDDVKQAIGRAGTNPAAAISRTFNDEVYNGNLHQAVIDTVYSGVFGPRGGFGGENPGYTLGLEEFLCEY